MAPAQVELEKIQIKAEELHMRIYIFIGYRKNK